MSTPGQKDMWDKVGALTPLILGLFVGAVGTAFTAAYNHQQVQLNQIAALDKLRPLLTSTSGEDRAFAYASFTALGYEELAIELIKARTDESGRNVLTQLKASPQRTLRAQAGLALDVLDNAAKVVYLLEMGDTSRRIDTTYSHYRPLTDSISGSLGVSTPLGRAIMYAAFVQYGPHTAQAFVSAATSQVPPPIHDRRTEGRWLRVFLTHWRSQAAGQQEAIRLSVERHVDTFVHLLDIADWDLTTPITTPAQVN